MSEDKCNINWHSYSDHLREMLHEMMKTNELTDVTLVSDDKIQFKAHKIVLSACSSVFKSIISDLPQNSSVIFLRGIQHKEIHSILEFMYLGKATFHQERMNEFLNVARNLEIKEINFKDVEFGINNEVVERPEISDNDIDDIINDIKLKSEPQLNTTTDENSIGDRKTGIDLSQLQKNIEGMFNCGQCDSEFLSKSGWLRHFKAKHQGIKYPCNKCDHQATDKGNLTKHIQSQHKGVKYPCNQCDYKASYNTDLLRHELTAHNQSKHSNENYPQSLPVLVPYTKL